MDGARGEEDALLCVTMNTPWRYSQFQNTGGISWWESFYIFGANVQF